MKEKSMPGGYKTLDKEAGERGKEGRQCVCAREFENNHNS